MEDIKMLASPPCTSPSVTDVATPQLKRKRSDSGDSPDAPVATKPRLDDPPDEPNGVDCGSATVNHSSPFARPVADKPASHAINVSKIRETLDAQLSLEVLLKHNELRLIDQEIAKCQIALEQLRRCAEIPYPGSNVTGPSQSVSNGTGMAVLRSGNGPAPLSPAPWGVTDGAYTRHYSKWLIPDPRFDGGEPVAGPPLAAGPSLEGRATRANPGDVAGKSRARSSAGVKHTSLPSNYPPPKEKSGPMLIRRKSDGVLVKLICLDCQRDNFSSTQGFINHCRIAHNRNFASHDAAAVASGEPVEVNEAGSVVDKTAAPNGGSGYVHPLVRSAHVIESTPTPGSRTPWKSPTDESVETPRSRKRKRASGTHAFTASPATPHLSSLMQMKGVGMDLGQLVGEAKTGVDLEAYSSDGESDDDSAQPSKRRPPAVGTARQPMRTVAQTAQRPPSRKGRGKSRKPNPLKALAARGTYTSPYGPVPSLDGQEAEGVDPSAHLSPNTELNQAPSLVSDDDDYEAAVDSACPSPSSSEAGDHDQDLGHINVEDDEGTSADAKANPELAGQALKPLRRKSKDGLVSPMVLSQDKENLDRGQSPKGGHRD